MQRRWCASLLVLTGGLCCLDLILPPSARTRDDDEVLSLFPFYFTNWYTYIIDDISRTVKYSSLVGGLQQIEGIDLSWSIIGIYMVASRLNSYSLRFFLIDSDLVQTCTKFE